MRSSKDVAKLKTRIVRLNRNSVWVVKGTEFMNLAATHGKINPGCGIEWVIAQELLMGKGQRKLDF